LSQHGCSAARQQISDGLTGLLHHESHFCPILLFQPNQKLFFFLTNDESTAQQEQDYLLNTKHIRFMKIDLKPSLTHIVL
jgi:hypothetical protein